VVVGTDNGQAEDAAGPRVEPDRVTFRYRAPAAELSGISVLQEVAEPRSGPRLSDIGQDLWEGVLLRPAVDRLEYRFELERPGGERETVLDPANPLTAPGAFGERSVIEFPGYVPPAWLGNDPPAGDVQEIDVLSDLLGEVQPTIVWSAAGTDPEMPLPLLVALDGAEFARFSGLLRMLDAHVATGMLPPMRAALCHPTRRDEHYSASPQFAAYLAQELIAAVQAVGAVAPEAKFRAGLGASLGGLALLHAHRSSPELFGSMFLQSSSLFHESREPGSAHLERIEQFVGDVLAAGSWQHPIDVAMTCGAVERNLANNEESAAALETQGYAVELRIVRDAHNWIAWRDAWTPHLVGLLGKVWH
jgi:enterochelin esterase family protein